LSGDKNPMLSAEQAMERFMADVDRAIANAENPSLKLAAELNREWFSPTWHRMPVLIASFRGQIDSYPWRNTDDGWLPGILSILGEYEMYRVLAEARLTADPLDPRGLDFMFRVELFSGNFDAARELLRRRRDVNGETEGLPEIYLAHAEGNREEFIRRMEAWVETRSNPWTNSYLAAVKGDYAEATRLMDERAETTPFPESSRAYWLIVLHETDDKERSRELTRRLDALPDPEGFLILPNWAGTFGNLFPFDLADAPNYAGRLQQAGVDLDSFKELPRLSTMGETSQ